MSRMSREEAKIFLFSIADDLGFTDIENYTCKDGKKMREAIEVLSPCDDAVSRDELLKAIDTWDKFGYTETGCFVREPKGDYVLYIHYDDVIKCIKGMPPVTQKSETVTEFADRCRECGAKYGKLLKQKSGKWIPVSERLPKDGTYLVTVERIDGEPRIDIKSFAKDLNKVDEFDFPKHKCGWYDYDSEYGFWEDTRVTAWRPLPKPYEPQESEDKE